MSIEKKQVRSFHRVPDNFVAKIILNDHSSIDCTVVDFSSNGLGIFLPKSQILSDLYIQKITLKDGNQSYTFPVNVINSRDNIIGLKLDHLDKDQSIAYIRCTFGRFGIWDNWQKNIPQDQIFKSLISFIWTGMAGYGAMLKFIKKKLMNKLPFKKSPT